MKSLLPSFLSISLSLALLPFPLNAQSVDDWIDGADAEVDRREAEKDLHSKRCQAALTRWNYWQVYDGTDTIPIYVSNEIPRYVAVFNRRSGTQCEIVGFIGSFKKETSRWSSDNFWKVTFKLKETPSGTVLVKYSQKNGIGKVDRSNYACPVNSKMVNWWGHPSGQQCSTTEGKSLTDYRLNNQIPLPKSISSRLNKIKTKSLLALSGEVVEAWKQDRFEDAITHSSDFLDKTSNSKVEWTTQRTLVRWMRGDSYLAIKPFDKSNLANAFSDFSIIASNIKSKRIYPADFGQVDLWKKTCRTMFWSVIWDISGSSDMLASVKDDCRKTYLNAWRNQGKSKISIMED